VNDESRLKSYVDSEVVDAVRASCTADVDLRPPPCVADATASPSSTDAEEIPEVDDCFLSQRCTPSAY